MERGDPIAETALGIVRNDTKLGQFSNFRLKQFIKQSQDWKISDPALNNRVEQIGRDLMREHTRLIDRGVTPTPEEIAGYHHRVFGEYGIPKRAFGGTALSGLEDEADVYEWLWMNKAGS